MQAAANCFSFFIPSSAPFLEAKTGTRLYCCPSQNAFATPARSSKLRVMLEGNESTTQMTRSGASAPVASTCACGRRHLLGASGTALLSALPVGANDSSSSDPVVVTTKFRPTRPEWYEEFFAMEMDQTMKSFEEEVAGYKSKLFSRLKGDDMKVLELGVGTGPNLRYYAGATGVTVFGIDPNKRMEKYARATSVACGLPSTHFIFMEGVAEALPIRDSSMDAVIGTLVLCSVRDVCMALKEVKRVLKPGGQYFFVEHVAARDGTSLRFIQNVFDPLQQVVSDGCHLTRETGKNIAKAGFSNLILDTIFLSNVFLISPIVYGVACK